MSENKSNDKGLVLVGHALVWAAAMIAGSYMFKGQLWAEDLLLWMIAGFVLTNGLLMTALGRSRPGC